MRWLAAATAYVVAGGAAPVHAGMARHADDASPPVPSPAPAMHAMPCMQAGGHSGCTISKYCPESGQCMPCDFCKHKRDAFDGVCPQHCSVCDKVRLVPRIKSCFAQDTQAKECLAKHSPCECLRSASETCRTCIYPCWFILLETMCDDVHAGVEGKVRVNRRQLALSPATRTHAHTPDRCCSADPPPRATAVCASGAGGGSGGGDGLHIHGATTVGRARAGTRV